MRTLPFGRGLGLLFLLLAAAAGCVLGGGLHSGNPAFEVGLWVQAEGANRTLDDARKIEALVLQARAAGVTDIYAQVYRGGRAWYPTSLADDAPARRAGRDPLEHLLRLASEPGPEGRPIRVHAWINSFALHRNRSAPLLAELGEEAVLRDQHGRSLLDYPPDGRPPWARGFGLGTPGIFLDPAHPGVRRRLVDIAIELIERYPGLAGIHLDFIRYPYALPIAPGSRFSPRLDFGYGPASAARFRAETGRTAPAEGASAGAADREAWDDWRRRQVTEAVRDVREALRAFRPGALLSAAVLPWADRAYLASFQDWRGWLVEGLLDKALLMNYTRDAALASHISRGASAARGAPPEEGEGGGARVLIGLGAYLFEGDPEGLWRQWRDARRSGADGVVLFSYDQMAGRDALWRFPSP